MKKKCCAVLAALLLLTGCLGLDGTKDVLPPPSGSSQEAVSTSQGAFALPGASSQSRAPLPATFKLVVPEGYTLARIGMTLEEEGICTAQEFIEAAQTGDYAGYSLIGALVPNENRCYTLEGYLFPATYEFSEEATPDEIIRTMLNTMEKRMDDATRAGIAASGFSADEIVTLASMIEKEAFGIEVMNTISSVFHNRLAQGMQLQSDPTIKYVEGAIKPFIDGDVDRYNDYYNTYTCPALPAGPICNPGMAAISAALAPAATDYLFFVTDANKQYYFAITYEEHLANIEQIKAAGLWA